MYIYNRKKTQQQDSNQVNHSACNCGGRFLKSIHFKEIDMPNDIRMNKWLKNEFYHYLNCYAYRHMNYVKRNFSPNVVYCHMYLTDSHDLYVIANKWLIEEMQNVLARFDNTDNVLIVNESSFKEESKEE